MNQFTEADFREFARRADAWRRINVLTVALYVLLGLLCLLFVAAGGRGGPGGALFLAIGGIPAIAVWNHAAKQELDR